MREDEPVDLRPDNSSVGRLAQADGTAAPRPGPIPDPTIPNPALTRPSPALTLVRALLSLHQRTWSVKLTSLPAKGELLRIARGSASAAVRSLASSDASTGSPSDAIWLSAPNISPQLGGVGHANWPSAEPDVAPQPEARRRSGVQGPQWGFCQPVVSGRSCSSRSGECPVPWARSSGFGSAVDGAGVSVSMQCAAAGILLGAASRVPVRVSRREEAALASPPGQPAAAARTWLRLAQPAALIGRSRCRKHARLDPMHVTQLAARQDREKNRTLHPEGLWARR